MISKDVKGICENGCKGLQDINYHLVGYDSIGDENEPMSTQIMCMGCRSTLVIPGTKLLDY